MTCIVVEEFALLELDELAQAVGKSADAFYRALAAIDKSGYNTFALVDGDKRRVISAPRPWLKKLQREAYDKVLSSIPTSPDVYGVSGRGVIQNAEQHLSNPYMVVLDVDKCFPSTSSSRVLEAFGHVGFPAATAGALVRLCTYHGILPQGPPSSPAILNVVFRPIDEELAALASQYEARYTRYMDDLCFSGPAPLRRLATLATAVLRNHGYCSNPNKRRVWGPDDPHTVTKIVVSSTLNPNPDYLRDLTRELINLRRQTGAAATPVILARLGWVTRLNPALGAELRKLVPRSVR